MMMSLASIATLYQILSQLVAEKLPANLANEPDMEFPIFLASVIVCLQLHFVLYNTRMT
jgi:hypothetical protein